MQWRIIAVLATLIPIIIIALQFDIQLEDLLAIGLVPFMMAFVLMMSKLVLQGVKFAYIAKAYTKMAGSATKLCGVRVGAEFIKFSTPMFVGAEFIMIYYLHKRKVPPSQSAWIAFVDIVTEVLGAGILSIMAGVIALLMGAYTIGVIVLLTSISITAIWTVLFFLSARRNFRVPKSLRVLISRVGGERGEHYTKEIDKWLDGICKTSQEHASSKRLTRVFTNSLIMSIASWILYGLSFFVIAIGVGYQIGAFDSTMAVMAANAIANLPITVGGSGLAELGIFGYLNNANPFDFQLDEGGVEWDIIVGWRIATYYIPIVITWLLLVKLALSKVTRADIKDET